MKDKSLENIKRKYMQKAVRVCLFLRLIPFLRMVGLNGSMVRGEFREDSDIDFLIISANNRIFFVRQFVMFFLTIFGFKRSNQNIAGQICPNRWATTNKLQVTPKDDYHAWTFSSTIPIYAQAATYEKFIKANGWMDNQGFPVKVQDILIPDSRLIILCKTWLESRLSGKLGNYFENIFKKSQLKRIKKKTEGDQNMWNIQISDDELCFHLKKEYVQHNLKPPIKTNG